MAIHQRGSRNVRQDVRPPERRFDYVDRMREDEADGELSARQREEAWRASLPPVQPDQVLQVDGRRFPVYLDGNARELRRRDAAAKKLREGGRQ